MNLEKKGKNNQNNPELENFLKINNFEKDFFHKNYQRLIDKYLKSYYLCNFKHKNDDLKSINVDCKQKFKGYRYIFISDNKKNIRLGLTHCFHGLKIKNFDYLERNYLLTYFSKNMKEKSFENDFIIDQNNKKLINFFLTKVKMKKGIYLHGSSNIGKTYFFILAANYFAKDNKTVCFLDWPNFISDIKTKFINNNQFYDIFLKLKNCDILFIDDLGNEFITKWVRDEILMNIINSRWNDLKLTFINSNYSFDKLIKFYFNKDQEEKDYLKMEKFSLKLKALMDFYFLDKKN
jgi:primosomal protein DnaI